MPLKYVTLNDALYEYVTEQRSDCGDAVLEALRTETEGLGEVSKMQISAEQGAFMTLLTSALGVKSAIEVGTFTGYSSLCIARGLASGGKLICIDASAEWTTIAQRYWAKAGVRERIELRLGSAIPLLTQLPAGLNFDFAFIDAAKTEYDQYYESILPRVRSNGLIVFDNMLWGGRLGVGPIADEDGQAIDRLNRKLAKDARVQCVLLPIADGLQFCRKV